MVVLLGDFRRRFPSELRLQGIHYAYLTGRLCFSGPNLHLMKRCERERERGPS